MRIIIIYNNYLLFKEYKMDLINLANCNRYDMGMIREINELNIYDKSCFSVGEVEARLLEMGLIEGARVEVLHLGAFGKEPIAIRINNSNSIIALRKNEASAVLLEKIKND